MSGNLKLLITSLALCAGFSLCQAQTVKRQVIEDGGSGPYKAEIVSDSTLQGFTVYRPQNLKELVKATGELPVILYANGACANNNLEARYFLNEIASHGFVAVAIGPYDENDFAAHWRETLNMMGPTDRETVTLANGEVVKLPTAEERQNLEETLRKMLEEDMKKAQTAKTSKESSKQAAAPAVFKTYPRQMLEALDWLTDRNADPNSEYYHCLDLDKVAAMGQSCGGAQTLAVAHDPRVKTCIILNSGIGKMTMEGITAAQLENLHTPMFYLIGGPDDVAYNNAIDDFNAITDVPVVMINTTEGHLGTYYEAHGGSYAVAVNKWLQWQLNGKVEHSSLFLDDEYFHLLHPSWTVERKNF